MSTLLEGGHTETILCAATDLEGHILSGGESGQLCCWSLDGTQPQKHKISNVADDVTSISCSRIRAHEIFVACGQKVLGYDQRQMKDALFMFECNEDEINQIVLHEKEEYLAACDDSGQIKVFNLPEKRLYKTLRKHTNICSTIAFRPNRTWDMLSGGLDNMLLQWDVSRNRSVCNINMQDLGIVAENPESYSVNPPFVYSLAVSSNGNYVACGTENALVQVFDGRQRTLTHLNSLRGHTNGVSQVHFPCFNENMLVSGGNDGKINLWDAKDCGAQPLTNGHGHTNGQGNRQRRRRADRHARRHENGGNSGEQTAQAEEDISEEKVILPKHVIEHGEKINWITSVDKNGQNMLVVVDNSVKLTLYDIPQ